MVREFVSMAIHLAPFTEGDDGVILAKPFSPPLISKVARNVYVGDSY